MSIDAIGYLRSDISGIHQQADEECMRAYSKRAGYNLRKTIVFSSRTEDPGRRLGMVLDRMSEVRVVVVPNEQHFDGGVPGSIAGRADVVVVAPLTALARLAWAAR